MLDRSLSTPHTEHRMLSTGQGSHSQHNGQDLYHPAEENQMKRWWQESLSESMGLPEGYTKVSVLIIKWEERLDQLKVGVEVQTLQKVFEVDFGYETKILALGPKSPQLQLLNGVTGFIVENDGRHNLMIIYYAGHGVFHENSKLLELSPSNEEQPPGMSANKVFWNEAEKFFAKDAESDVLSIMDCCYSSNLVRSSGSTNRAFEMLAASGIDRVTEEPGEASFTTALVKSLRKLALDSSGGCFSTWDLLEEIQRQRVTNPPALWRRLSGNNRHIQLHPSGSQKSFGQLPVPRNYRGHLTLRFELLQNDLSRECIQELATHLPKTFDYCKLPLRNIQWLDFTSDQSSSVQEPDFANVGFASFANLAMIAILIIRLHRRRLGPPSVDSVGFTNKLMDRSVSTRAWSLSEKMLRSGILRYSGENLSFIDSFDFPKQLPSWVPNWVRADRLSMACPTLNERVPDDTARPFEQHSISGFWTMTAFEIKETIKTIERFHYLWKSPCDIGGHCTKTQTCLLYIDNYGRNLRKGIIFPPLLPITRIIRGNYTAHSCSFTMAQWVGDSTEEPKKFKTENNEVKLGRRTNARSKYVHPFAQSLVNQDYVASLPFVDHGLSRIKTKGSGGSSSPKCGSNGNLYGCRQVSRRGNNSKKTKRSRQDFDETDEEEDERKRRKKRRTEDEEATSELSGDRRFGCPYYKRRPHENPKATSCVFPGFRSLARLKEHLYRTHRLPIECPRCREAFKSDAEVASHLKSRQICTLVEGLSHGEGFNKQQEEEIRSKRLRGVTDEEKWRSVYIILFPSDPVETIPNPYLESSTVRAPQEDQLAPEFERFETFISRELREILRQLLEDPLEQNTHGMHRTSSNDLAEICLRAQQEAYRRFRAQSTFQSRPSEGPENGNNVRNVQHWSGDVYQIQESHPHVQAIQSGLISDEPMRANSTTHSGDTAATLENQERPYNRAQSNAPVSNLLPFPPPLQPPGSGMNMIPGRVRGGLRHEPPASTQNAPTFNIFDPQTRVSNLPNIPYHGGRNSLGNQLRTAQRTARETPRHHRALDDINIIRSSNTEFQFEMSPQLPVELGPQGTENENEQTDVQSELEQITGEDWATSNLNWDLNDGTDDGFYPRWNFSTDNHPDGF